jgi:hypothetical protein
MTNPAGRSVVVPKTKVIVLGDAGTSDISEAAPITLNTGDDQSGFNSTRNALGKAGYRSKVFYNLPMFRSRVVRVLLLICVLSLPAGLSAQNAVSLFDQFTKLFEDNYAFFQLRGVDWEKQKETYRSRIINSTSDDELFSIFCQMIKRATVTCPSLGTTRDATRAKIWPGNPKVAIYRISFIASI